MLVAFQEVLDEALLNLATGVTSSVMTEPNLKPLLAVASATKQSDVYGKKTSHNIARWIFYFAMLVTLKREKALLPLRSQLLAVAK